MLTGTGRAVTALGGLLLAAGWAAGYPELVVLGLACLILVLAASAWMLTRPDLSAERTIRPESVQQGDDAVGVLTLTNRSRRRSPPVVAVERVGDREVPVDVPSLPGQGSQEVTYPLPTQRRGVFAVGPLTLGHADPLRLMRVARSFASQTTLCVHPLVHDVPPLPTGRSRDMDGPTSDTAPRGGIAFHSLREFRPGDERRLIHWRSSARLGTLMVRHHVVPNEPRMLVVLDTSAAPYAGDEESFEDAVRVAASLAAAACLRGYPLQLRTTGGALVSAERGEGLRPVLDLLAALEPEAADPGLAALTGMVPREEGVCLGVVSGQADAGSLAAVGLVRQRFQMASLVTVGERHGRPGAPLRGVVALNVARSTDFARAWTRLVGR